MTSFRTKTGHCEVSPERLRLVRTGPRGAMAERLQGDSKSRTMGLYVLVMLALGFMAWRDWSRGWTLSLVFDGILSAFY